MKTTEKTIRVKTQIPTTITKLRELRYFKKEYFLYFPTFLVQLSNTQKLKEVKVELQQTVNHQPRMK